MFQPFFAHGCACQCHAGADFLFFPIITIVICLVSVKQNIVPVRALSARHLARTHAPFPQKLIFAEPRPGPADSWPHSSSKPFTRLRPLRGISKSCNILVALSHFSCHHWPSQEVVGVFSRSCGLVSCLHLDSCGILRQTQQGW